MDLVALERRLGEHGEINRRAQQEAAGHDSVSSDLHRFNSSGIAAPVSNSGLKEIAERPPTGESFLVEGLDQTGDVPLGGVELAGP